MSSPYCNCINPKNTCPDSPLRCMECGKVLPPQRRKKAVEMELWKSGINNLLTERDSNGSNILS